MLVESSCIKLNLPAHEYHDIDALSSSGIKKLLMSPEHFKKTESKTSPQMKLGTLVHTAILEPHLFERNLIIMPEGDGRTKEMKALKAQKLQEMGGNPDAIICTQKEADTAKRMRDSFASKHIAKEVFGAQAEVSLHTPADDDKPAFKGRLDLYKDHFIYDIKTCQYGSANPDKFKWSIKNFRYDIQWAFYKTLLGTVLGCSPRNVGFIFIAIESESPFHVRTFALTKQEWYEAFDQIDMAIELYKQCSLFNQWECDYTKEVVEL